MKELLSDIGEKEVLNRLKRYMPINQMNNDTAEIKASGKDLIINNDLLVDGIHFSESTTSCIDIGWKAVTTNFSDLASSGVEEIIGITVGMVAPPDTCWQWVEEVYEGMKLALNKFGGHIIGGDCSKGIQKVLSITAFGTAGNFKLHQANALPGDWIIASGPHGLSRLGLAILTSDPLIKNSNIPASLKSKAIEIHQRPIPPLQALERLKRCKPKDMPLRAAATDSSDGLLQAIHNLCINSKCQAVLKKSSLPRSNKWPLGNHWDEWCLTGGEDFELIISLPPEWGKEMLKASPNYSLIGIMKEGDVKISWEKENKNLLETYKTFKHF